MSLNVSLMLEMICTLKCAESESEARFLPNMGKLWDLYGSGFMTNGERVSEQTAAMPLEVTVRLLGTQENRTKRSREL